MVTHNKLKWPQSFATVFRHVLPEQVLEAVKDEAETWAKCPNYWVPKVFCPMIERINRIKLAAYVLAGRNLNSDGRIGGLQQCEVPFSFEADR